MKIICTNQVYARVDNLVEVLVAENIDREDFREIVQKLNATVPYGKCKCIFIGVGDDYPISYSV